MGQNKGRAAAAPLGVPRWTVAAVVVAAVIAAGCGATPVAPSRPASPGATPPAVPAPSVNAAAFGGHGELAFVSRGTLWVLNGAAGTLRRVATPGMTPLDPAFSPDGRWLAFLGSSTSPSVQTDTVWLAGGDGGGAHQIVASGGLIGWSPATDVLAVTAGNVIRLIQPPARARTLTRAAGMWPPVWSPDGRYLAVATRDWPSATTLASYPVAGGKPTVWLRLNARGGVLNGMNEIIIDPAGWWPRWGIGFWVFGDGMVHNNDQTPLDVISAPGARPRLLGYTLSGNSAPEAVAAPNGWLAIVNNPSLRNIGRIIWQDKQVEACRPVDGRCTAVPSRPSAVTLDPAWSPDGSRLAYVQAPYRASPGFPQNVAVAWYDAHQLWLYDPASRSMHRLNASGASVPVWSADSKSLFYVARDGLWLLPRLTGQPVQIAGPLFPPNNWPAYYGQVDWISQFAWWSGSSPAAPSATPPGLAAVLASVRAFYRGYDAARRQGKPAVGALIQSRAASWYVPIIEAPSDQGSYSVPQCGFPAGARTLSYQPVGLVGGQAVVVVGSPVGGGQQPYYSVVTAQPGTGKITGITCALGGSGAAVTRTTARNAAFSLYRTYIPWRRQGISLSKALARLLASGPSSGNPYFQQVQRADSHHALTYDPLLCSPGALTNVSVGAVTLVAGGSAGLIVVTPSHGQPIVAVVVLLAKGTTVAGVACHQP